jgi:O-antigen/teichoic acid export membrane protein
VSDALAIFVRGLGGVIQFLVILFLGRQYGVVAVGFYGLGVAVTVFSGTLISLGLPGYLTHLNSVRFAEGDHATFRGNLVFAARLTILTGAAAQIVMGFVGFLAWEWLVANNIGARIVIAAPTLGAVMGVVLIATYGLRARNQALVANTLDRPLFHLATLGLFVLVLAGMEAYDTRVLASVALGALITMVVSWLLVIRGLDDRTETPRRDTFERPLLGSYFASIVVDIILARTPILLGSFFFTAGELGSFQIAFSFAASVIVLQEALGGVIGPRFAVLASQGASTSALKLHHKSQAFLFLMVAPLLFVLYRFPDAVVGLVGEELGDATLALGILVIGAAVRCSVGVYRSIFEATGSIKYGLYTGTVAIVVLMVGIMALSDQGAVGLATAWTAATIVHALLGYVLCEYVLRTWIQHQDPRAKPA